MAFSVGRALLAGALLGTPPAFAAEPPTFNVTTENPLPVDLDVANSLECLTAAIAHEAAYEPLEGQQAVAQVVLNRLRAKRYPKSVCQVIYQGSERKTGCQFTFTCDGSLRRRLPLAAMSAAKSVARSALDGTLPDRVGGATYYHANYVSPRWAPQLVKIGQIGAHIFYRASSDPSNASFFAGSAAVPSGSPLAPPLPSNSEPRRGFSPWGLSVTQAPITPPPGQVAAR